MRRNVEVFINNQRVDLFDFEDINIVDSVQDVRDVAKIFVPYSREFTVPASKNNNKIFKHYYNNDIINSFDEENEEQPKDKIVCALCGK